MEDLGKQIEELIASKKAKITAVKSEEKKEPVEKEQHTMSSSVNEEDALKKANKVSVNTNEENETIEKKQSILNSIDEIIASKEKAAQLAKQNLEKVQNINISVPKNDVKKSVSAEMDDVLRENNTSLLDENFKEKSISVKDEKNNNNVVNTAKNGFGDEKQANKQNSLITKKDIITELRLAKKGHKQWIADVHVLTRIGNIEEAKSTIPISFTSCDFGKWYYGDGQMLAEFEEYQNLEKAHQKIHDIYLQIFNLYKIKVEGSFFKSTKKQLKERENKAVVLSKNLDYQSDLLFKNLLLLEDTIKKLSDTKMAELNLV